MTIAFGAQIRSSARTTAEALEKDPSDRRAQFFATLFLEMGAKSSPTLSQAKASFAAWRKNAGDAHVASALRENGMRAFLETTWEGLGQSHYFGSELTVLARWLVFVVDSAEDLAQLPYAIGNWNAGWSSVGPHAAKACETLAAAALKLDPQNEAALYLYAQPDFVKCVNRSRKKGEKLTRPPVPKAQPSDRVAKIEAILKKFEQGVHPLEIPSMDPIAVDAPEVVDALIRGIACKEWRGGSRCIEALGRATVAIPRVVAIFSETLANGNPKFTDAVAMAVHYGLEKNGGAMTEPLLRKSELLIASLSEKDTSDYRHQWPLRSFLTVAPFASKESKAVARSFIEQLLAQLETMPAWKRERLGDFAAEAPSVLAKL